MYAAVNSDVDKKKTKKKSVLGICNSWLTKMVPTNSKSSLKTDAVPLDNSGRNAPSQTCHQSNGSHENIDNQVMATTNNNNDAQIALSPMQLIQNNMRPTNQNLTVVENQQNLHFNNINGLQIGNTYHLSGNSARKDSCNRIQEDKTHRKKSKSVVELMSNTDEIEPPVMRIAAKYIGENWRMVFRHLDVPDSEISQIKEQYFHINVEEVIYQLLLRWKRNSDDCCIGKLTKILWKTNNDECLTELKKYYKDQKKTQVGSVIDSS